MKALLIQLHGNEDHRDWDKRLPTVLFALRNHSNEATCMSRRQTSAGQRIAAAGRLEPSERETGGTANRGQRRDSPNHQKGIGSGNIRARTRTL